MKKATNREGAKEHEGRKGGSWSFKILRNLRIFAVQNVLFLKNV